MYNASPPPPPPHYAQITQPPLFPVVRLRGLPFDCSDADVIEFLQGLNLVDILFVHKNGRFSGEAFIVLGHPVDVDYALQRNRQNMGRRYIEVFRGKRQEYYKAIANEVAETQGRGGGSPPPAPRRKTRKARSPDESKDSEEHTGVLRLRGLPFSAGKEDLVDFFKEFALSEDPVHIVMNKEGRPSGEAFVEFLSADESKAAMVKDRMSIGKRWLELFPSSQQELDEAMSKKK
ncbi:hypothetical protein ACHQM5_019038 [Ranunculus cassubicifolius]